ncbi:MAG: RNA polymerase sigma factor [Akkermansia muciniphila]|nr:sigma-70 family RNA polymerase sigma factor [Akkermansia sp.]
MQAETPGPEDIPEQEQVQEAELEKLAARTRRSLINRLKDWEDRRSWDEFYRTYWRLIYSIALKAGLRHDEAWDVVQETVLTIAKQSKKEAYDPARGSFKMWLWNITRWRINDQFRRRKKDTAPAGDPNGEDPRHALENYPGNAGEEFEAVWEREWQKNVIKAAVERVKQKVTPKQFQIFECNVLRGMDAGEVRRKLGVSMAQVYLAKFRVGAVFRKEVEYIRSREGQM